KKFKEITKALVERTIAFTHEMLEKAGEKGYQKFDEIILVGGATRMPQIVSRIKKEFSMEPKIFDPDEAVAKGAAIFGSKLMLNDELIQRIVKRTGTKVESDWGMEEKAKIIDSIPGAILLDTVKEVSEVTGYTLPAVKESFVKIKDVTSKSFGIVVENAGMQEEVFNLIVKNTTVPIDIAKHFYTSSENQKTVLIRIMENEINEQVVPLEHSTEIATAILNLPHGLSKESPVQIIFRLNEEGRLKITAAEKTESKLVKVDIETRSVIQGKAFQEAKARCQSLTIH
ncbi:MAG: Hsp70 family protein, partial [Deltaproteobacteria bacterium]|nr:Hsp70 family protein [Deltaproteobacteria bacterium]